MLSNNSSSNLVHSYAVSIGKVETICYEMVLILLMTLTLFGNSLVCLACWRFRNLRSLTNYFVCSLSIADFLVPVLRVVYIIISLFVGKWVFGTVWCRASSMCGVLLCGASILHLSAISVERLIAIRWPLTYSSKITPRRTVCILVYIWVQSITLSLLPMTGLAEHRFNPHIVECEINWMQQPTLTILLMVFYFFLPMTIMLVAYVLIFKEVRRNTRRLSSIEPSGSHSSRNSKAKSVFKKELKAVKILAVVIGVFFIMWMPYFVTTTIRGFSNDSAISPTVQRTVITLAYANSCCNFVIYACMNVQFRMAFLQLIKNFKQRRLTGVNDTAVYQPTEIALSPITPRVGRKTASCSRPAVENEIESDSRGKEDENSVLEKRK